MSQQATRSIGDMASNASTVYTSRKEKKEREKKKTDEP